MPGKAQIDVPVGVNAHFERKPFAGGLHAPLPDVGLAKEREQTIGSAIVFDWRKFAQRDADRFSFQNLFHVANPDIAYARRAAAKIFREFGRCAGNLGI
jgi:hypothetical protein